VDNIEFIARLSGIEDYQVVDVFINGFNLINIISTEEQAIFPLNHISAYPGLYEGIPPLLSLFPKQHFWGKADQCYQIKNRRVAVLESSRTGVPGEWTVSAEIIVDGEKVVWQNFRHEQLNIEYKMVGPFEFELVGYSRALKNK